MADKDLEMKKKFQEMREEQAMAESNKKLLEERALSKAKSIDSLRKGRKSTNEHGQEIDLWEEVNKKAKLATNLDNVMSYNDWRSAMMALLAMYFTLCKALSQSRSEVFAEIGHGALDKIVQGYTKLRQYGPKPDVVLPALSHSVSFNDKNEIQFDKLELETSDGSLLDGSLDSFFQKGIVAWLDKCGYEPSKENPNKFLSKEDGSELTKAEFDELKNDEGKGLAAYLSDRFDLQITQRPSPRIGG